MFPAENTFKTFAKTVKQTVNSEILLVVAAVLLPPLSSCRRRRRQTAPLFRLLFLPPGISGDQDVVVVHVRVVDEHIVGIFGVIDLSVLSARHFIIIEVTFLEPPSFLVSIKCKSNFCRPNNINHNIKDLLKSMHLAWPAPLRSRQHLFSVVISVVDFLRRLFSIICFVSRARQNGDNAIFEIRPVFVDVLNEELSHSEVVANERY